MKTGLMLVVTVAAVSIASAEGIVLEKAQGEVSVRHGVTEQWVPIGPGELLKPDDTMKTGKKGSAVLVTEATKENGNVSKTITLPPEVIVDMSDIRELSQEELMLKLTMEKVRSSSYEWKNDELHIPNAAVIHGANQGDSAPLKENDPLVGMLQWNGTKVLFANGYYSTCVLRAMEIFRLYPSVGERFENRLMVADALEKTNLHGEALNEYGSLAEMQGLTPEQQSIVRERIARLKR